MEPKRMILSHSEPDCIARPVTCPALPLTAAKTSPGATAALPGLLPWQLLQEKSV